MSSIATSMMAAQPTTGQRDVSLVATLRAMARRRSSVSTRRSPCRRSRDRCDVGARERRCRRGLDRRDGARPDAAGRGRREGARARRRWPVADVAGRARPRLGRRRAGRSGLRASRDRRAAWVLERSEAEQRLVSRARSRTRPRARSAAVRRRVRRRRRSCRGIPPCGIMLSRLRLAVELDCDARLLRRGAAARSYGALLIDVAERAAPLRLAGARARRRLDHTFIREYSP